MFDSVIEITKWKIKYNIKLSIEAEDELENLFSLCKYDDGCY